MLLLCLYYFVCRIVICKVVYRVAICKVSVHTYALQVAFMEDRMHYVLKEEKGSNCVLSLTGIACLSTTQDVHIYFINA